MKNNITKNRRDYYRVNFICPIDGIIHLLSINNRLFCKDLSNISITDISAGGLGFVSSLEFPLNNDAIFLFKFKIYKENFNLEGCIVRSTKLEDKLYSYGVLFYLNNEERKKLRILVDKICIAKKKGYEMC